MWSDTISRSKPRPSTVCAQLRSMPGSVPGPKFGTFTPISTVQPCLGRSSPRTRYAPRRVPAGPGAPGKERLAWLAWRAGLVDEVLDRLHAGCSPPEPPEQGQHVPEARDDEAVEHDLVRGVERPGHRQHEHDQRAVDQHEADHRLGPPAEREIARHAVQRPPLVGVAEGDEEVDDVR